MTSFKRDIFENDLSVHIPNVVRSDILSEMLAEVPESQRKTFRVGSKIHKVWEDKYSHLTVNQYLCLVTMTYEFFGELVESYQNGEIDEIEFTKAIAGERGKPND